jgi:hypothetical protein
MSKTKSALESKSWISAAQHGNVRNTLTDTSGQNVLGVSLKRYSFSGNLVSLSAIAFEFSALRLSDNPGIEGI